MLRVQKILNQLNDNQDNVYKHFWRRPKRSGTKQTETDLLHYKIKNNDYFIKEVDMDKNKLLVGINKYHKDKGQYSTNDIMNMFILWINTAFKYSPTFIKHPNAVCVSTIDMNNYPSSRYVLLKTMELNKGQFIFFTNFNSNKGHSILNVSNKVSMTFYWDILDLSVRIKGKISKVDNKLNDSYWSTRPRQSKIAAITSDQSSSIISKDELEKRYKIIDLKYKNTKNENIPRPKHWAGFAVNAEIIEFWNGDKYRFHDRSVFTKVDDKWTIKRLQP